MTVQAAATAEVLDQELEQKSNNLCVQAKEVKVTSPETFEQAAEYLQSVKRCQKEIKEWFAPMLKAANEAHKRIKQKEKDELNPLEHAERLLRQAINLYTMEQEKLRREEQRKLEERKAREAEKERQRLLERAARAEEKGKTETAEAIFSQAEEVVPEPVVAEPEVQKTTKLSSGSATIKKDLLVKVVDMKKFLQAISSDKFTVNLENIVQVKALSLKNWIKANGFKNGDIPGLSITETQNISVR